MPCVPLAFVRVHQMAPPRTVVTTSSCSLLLTYRPRKNERLSWPCWLTYTYSGRFTHISGHPSAVGRAQDSESSPVKDQRSTAEPRNQLWNTYGQTEIVEIILIVNVNNRRCVCWVITTKYVCFQWLAEAVIHPANFCTICTSLKSTEPGLHFASDSAGLSSFVSTQRLCKNLYSWRWRSALQLFKVIEIGTNVTISLSYIVSEITSHCAKNPCFFYPP